MQKSYYVYAHINPETKKAFYIGKGTKDRCYEKRSRSSTWKQYVSFLFNKGLAYGVDIRHTTELEVEAFKLEQIEISKELSNGNALFNVQSKAGLIIDEDVSSEEDQTTNVLSTFVRTKRKQQKLTQKEFAMKCGVGLRFIRELEKGKPSLRLDKINQVLRAFGHILSPTRDVYT